MHAQKAVAVQVFVELHSLHFSRSIIAKLTGFSAAYVGEVLFDLGMRERWDKPDDCRSALPPDLRESCDKLISVRAARPSTTDRRDRRPRSNDHDRVASG